MKKRSRRLSVCVLALCLIASFGAEGIVHAAQKALMSGYRLNQRVYFTLNTDFEHRAQIFAAQEAYAIVGTSSIQWISKTGTPLWEKTLSSPNVSAAVGATHVILGEQKAGDLFLLNDQGTLVAKRYGLGKLKKLWFFEDEWVLALSSSGILTLMDATLETVFSHKLPKGEVIDCTLDTEAHKIGILLLDLTSKPFNSKLLFMSFNGDIASGSSFSEQIAYAAFHQKAETTIITDVGAYTVDEKGVQKEFIPFEGILKTFFKRNGFWGYFIPAQSDTLLPSDDTGNRVAPFVNLESGFACPMNACKGVLPLGQDFLVYSERTVMVVDIAGKTLQTLETEDPIRRIYAVGGKGFAIEHINYLDAYVK